MSEMAVFAIVAALLGAILGSFINALSFRFNTGRGMRGRSRCMHCRRELGALDLVPILSFFFLRGRCRFCGTRLSFQYPLVEFTAAALAALVFLNHWPDLVASGHWLLVWMTLLFTVVYDLRHKIIPWSCSLLLAGLALVFLVWNLDLGFWSLAAGPLLATPLFLLWAVSGGRWMGLGDPLLMLSLGWFLGLTAGLTAFVIAVWVGAAVGIALSLVSKDITIKSEVPFAPFLVFGAFVSHFLHVDFFTTLYILW